MSVRTTAEVIARFNRAFTDREAGLLADLIAEDCVMESVQPAPRGERVSGREACTEWWTALVDDDTARFSPQEVIVADDRATIVWAYRFGDGPDQWVQGVNVMRVTDGRIVEALGFGKTAGEIRPAPESDAA
ncbi:nuclear transport factor 2 family protein [Streptomyces sp. TLI_105]|uniref:nuclear transport factor 2 family protein n=1 Tax=Streptomyces sp. TLI_105 TaxID=1881019 RepID=UPI0008952E89|nr:nuclear transport factor 2 family protein [Streptomyces sp. TLI_105]SEE02866.1 SnoaL-like domain-containing protein [Streptomyces sp. TLI_105]